MPILLAKNEKELNHICDYVLKVNNSPFYTARVQKKFNKEI